MEEKVKAAGLENIVSCEQGDCESLRFSDGAFDRVTVAFGVRNFENREKALKEILRVLRPGGELVILELSVPSNPVMKWLYNLYFLHIDVVCHDTQNQYARKSYGQEYWMQEHPNE